MALDTCNVHHGVKANDHCRSCHKPTCPQCKTRDSCCSDKCAELKAKFSTVRVPPRPKRHGVSIVSFLALCAAAYFAAKYMNYL